MIAGVADKHAALWYLHGNPRISATAWQFVDRAANAGHGIALSPVSLAELVYLIEKNRLPASAYADLKTALADRESVIEGVPFDSDIVEELMPQERPRAPTACLSPAISPV